METAPLTAGPPGLVRGRNRHVTCKPFCVVVHDVTPRFARDVDTILGQLTPLVGQQLASAVVPRWHGRAATGGDRACFRQWMTEFGETLLHGWTHCRVRRPGLVSAVTNRADEFGGLRCAEILARVREGQQEMSEILGLALRGFVPPAWQLPVNARELQPAGIDFVVRFTRLESSSTRPVPLATWSWDWGGVPGSGRIGSWIGPWRLRWQPLAIPCIVLHPTDVARGHLASAVAAIRHLLATGRTPCLPSQLLEASVPREC